MTISMTTKPTPSLIEREFMTVGDMAYAVPRHEKRIGVLEQRLAALQSTQAPDGFVMVKTMSEAEVKNLCENLYDRMPHKMEMAGYLWTRRCDAYRAIVAAVIKYLGLTTPDPAIAFFTAHPHIPDNADTRAVLAAQEVGK